MEIQNLSKSFQSSVGDSLRWTIFILFTFGISDAHAEERGIHDQPEVLTGDYFGQSRPGLKPEYSSLDRYRQVPETVDSTAQYMFYLHGKIVEDQELPAVSERFGEYEYEAILDKLSAKGFTVVSEKRPKDTSVAEYALTIVEQIEDLLDKNVPAKSITVVGASKGSYIAATASYLLKNHDLNFVLTGSCHSSVIDSWIEKGMTLYGNVLAIYDSSDIDLAGSCEQLAELSAAKGLNHYKEIVLSVGTGHGILYKPLDEWIHPTIAWAQSDYH